MTPIFPKSTFNVVCEMPNPRTGEQGFLMRDKSGYVWSRGDGTIEPVSTKKGRRFADKAAKRLCAYGHDFEHNVCNNCGLVQ